MQNTQANPKPFVGRVAGGLAVSIIPREAGLVLHGNLEVVGDDETRVMAEIVGDFIQKRIHKLQP